MIAVDAKEIYCFEVRVLKRFFCKARVQRGVVIRDFCLSSKKKYPKKVLSSMNQTNINLYMFRKEFLVKKTFICDEQCFLIFSHESLCRE